MTPSARANIILSLALGLTVLGGGCQKPVVPPSSAGTPQATSSPVAAQSPAPAQVSVAEEIESQFQEITQKYEADTSGELGYPLVEPLLTDSKIEELSTLNLDDPKAVSAFTKSTVPILEKSFSLPTFFPKERLLEGESQVNYRGLRTLVTLLAQVAEKNWEEGKEKEALRLAELPLSLARAIKSRPETVSVNLFSSSYADSTLSLYSEWAEQAAKKPEILKEMLQTLKDNQVPLAHLQETVLVDFAKLQNSLANEQSLSNMGIGRSDPASQARWKQQVQALFLAARKLYQTEPEATEAFNKEISAADGPIQGLVIDYPHVTTIQLHYFARYRSIRLGLALLGPEGQALKKLDSQAMIRKFFVDQLEDADTLNRLIEVKIDGDAIRIVGRPGCFELLSPGEPPTFFEYGKVK